MHEFRSIKELGKGFWCPDCNRDMDIVIQAPLLVKAAPEVRYDSPIDGTPITSWAARREDLAKHGCEAYDPGRKQDYHRRIQEHEQELDKSIDETVEATIERMPTKQRAQLHTELIEKSVTAEVIRK